MTRHAHVKAQVTHRFKASPERVFDAWLNPEFATRWLFTSPTSDPAGRRMEMDARVGGSYTIVDRRNGTDYIGDGEYEEIDRPHRIVFTFRMAQFSEAIDRVIIEIKALESGCELTLTQEITVPHEDSASPKQIQEMLAAYKGSTEKGWTKMFKALEKQLASHQ
ncbi:SRPBCC family protein [Paenibacillus mendelii]|uniref:SRPBCC domain-containing protein n=1 Tax=Paenibacillus mendelii TaxID=206163 RepID=A0ABV6JKX9_9BACL|nr:SRPBCC family protein [Paenibacillus mendelii]MCQ6560601.1 SRPBCC domain-containing protein [Paenibacillus mendelii]